MTVAVRVTVTVTGHRRGGVDEHDVALALPPGPVMARKLIEAAVIAQVTAYEDRAAQASMVRILTGKSLLADLEQGAVRMGASRGQARWTGPPRWTRPCWRSTTGSSRSSSAMTNWPQTRARSNSPTAQACCSCAWSRWQVGEAMLTPGSRPPGWARCRTRNGARMPSAGSAACRANSASLRRCS